MSRKYLVKLLRIVRVVTLVFLAFNLLMNLCHGFIPAVLFDAVLVVVVAGQAPRLVRATRQRVGLLRKRLAAQRKARRKAQRAPRKAIAS